MLINILNITGTSFASILYYICMCGSGSVFGIRIRIQEAPEYRERIQYGSRSTTLLLCTSTSEKIIEKLKTIVFNHLQIRIQVRLALNFLKKLYFAKFVASKKKNCDKKRLNVLMTRRRRQNTFLLKASLRKIIIIFRNWQDLLKFHRRSLQYRKNYWPPQSHFYTKILIAKAYY